MLVYDHALTFADEVEYIWKGKKTFVRTLLLILRYLVPAWLLVVNFICEFTCAIDANTKTYRVKLQGDLVGNLFSCSPIWCATYCLCLSCTVLTPHQVYVICLPPVIRSEAHLLKAAK